MLSLIASNTSEAYTAALGWVAQFMGADGTALELSSAQDFAVGGLQTLHQYMAAFSDATLPVDDYLKVLQRAGIVDPEKSPEEIRGQVDHGWTDSTPINSR